MKPLTTFVLGMCLGGAAGITGVIIAATRDKEPQKPARKLAIHYSTDEIKKMSSDMKWYCRDAAVILTSRHDKTEPYYRRMITMLDNMEGIFLTVEADCIIINRKEEEENGK